MENNASKPHGNSTERMLIFGISLLLVAIIWGSCFHLSAKMFQDEKKQMSHEATTALDASIQHTIQVISHVGVLLQGVRMYYLHCHSIAETELYIDTLKFDKTMTPNIFLVASDGRFLIPGDEKSRQLNISDRDYFRYLQANPGESLFISAVELGRITGRYHFRIAQRIENPDGSFDGIVLITVDPKLFTIYFQKLKLGQQFVASLVGYQDRRLRARIPEPDKNLWTVPIENPEWERIRFDATATIQVTSPYDQIFRTLFYKKVGDLPLGMMIGFSDIDVRSRIGPQQRWLNLVSAILTVFILFVTSGLLAKVDANLKMQQKNQLLLADLAAAARIQSALLPKMDLADQRVRMHLRFQPCLEVGGDMVNVIPFSETQVGVYCLDVSGHGVPAALTGVAVAHMLRSDGGIVCQTIDGTVVPTSPGEIIGRLERDFPLEELDQYFTMVFLLMDREKNQLRISAGGHPPPLLVLPDGQLREINIGGLPVGFGAGDSREEVLIEVPAGATLVLFSDGITEQADINGQRFGLERLRAALTRHSKKGLTDMIDAVWNEIEAWRGKAVQDDDMSLLGVQFPPAGTIAGKLPRS